MGRAEGERAEVVHLTDEVERLRQRSEDLADELVDRLEPEVRFARRLVGYVETIGRLAKRVAGSPLLIVAAGAIVGAGGGFLAGRAWARRRRRGLRLN